MKALSQEQRIALDVEQPIWDRFFTVAPLVVVGTREGEGYDLAPKHMVMPMGWSNYFGFVCTPRHGTYHNIKHSGVFTVSFPRPDQVVLTSLSASPRCDQAGHKPILQALPTFKADIIDGVFLEEAYLFFECELDRIIDGFGVNSLIVGRIVAAYVDKDALRVSEVDDQEMIHRAPMLVYLNPGRYARLSESLAFPFPAHFER